MQRWTERVLNLRPGGLGPALLLSSYYFLILSGYGVGKVARDALFLDRFTTSQLPYVYIANAVAVSSATGAELCPAVAIEAERTATTAAARNFGTAGSCECFIENGKLSNHRG